MGIAMYQTPPVRKGRRKEQNSVCSNRDFVEKGEWGEGRRRKGKEGKYGHDSGEQIRLRFRSTDGP